MAEENKTDNTKVRLPKTEFGAKVNFINLQTQVTDAWNKTDIYKQVSQKNKNGKSFILHDGPPYANGGIHLGHVLNKVLKDILIKGNWILGNHAPFILGWDCHGLPIEWKIEEQYKAKGIKKSEVPVNTLRNECADFADMWIELQKEEFKQLGILADYNNSYTTKQKNAESTIVQSIFTLLKGGSIYQDKKPITWSIVEQTALAEAEIEYKDVVTDSVYAGFELVEFSKADWLGAKIVIWTTTPWTLPANQALAMGAEIEYGLYKITETPEDEGFYLKGNFIIATALLDSFLQHAKGIKSVTKLDTSTGLSGGIAKHCFFGLGYDFTVPVLQGDFVDTSVGTGIVHLAPSHGEDDFYLCKKHNIKPKELVEGNGAYAANTPIFADMFITKVAPLIFENLKLANNFFASHTYKHSYPHSWRSKAPVIIRLTTQWFISLSANNVRQKALESLEKIDFYPKISKNRLKSMLENRPDWTISRQRAWGVPIALFVNKATKQPLVDDTLFANIVKVFKEEGSNSWFLQDPKSFLSALNYNPDEYDVVYDILDVWLESGLTQEFVLKGDFGLDYPADLYLEGSDQHRGWFQSSLIMSILLTGQAPFKKIITHGYVLDDKGSKMSKSAGNGVTAEQAIKDYGVDILRLWVASSNYFEDVNISKNILVQQTESYRKIRNTLKYLLGNLPLTYTTINYHNLEYTEKWLLHNIYELDKEFTNTIENSFAVQQFFHKLFTFIANDLSAFYFDIKKDVLYCDASTSHQFNSTITAMDILFEFLCKWLLPIIPFTMEEAYAIKNKKDLGQAMLHNYTSAPQEWCNNAIEDDFGVIKNVKKVVTGVLEVNRVNKIIGSSLEAYVDLLVNKSTLDILNKVNFADITIVSGIAINEYTNQTTEDYFSIDGIDNVFAKFSKHTGHRCARCWKYYSLLNNELCIRCESSIGLDNEAS